MTDKRDQRRTGVLVASRETLNTTATTRRKIPARTDFLQKGFSEKRKQLDAEFSIEGLLCRKRYSKMQRKQPTTSKGTERRFLGKSRRPKFGPELFPNQRARLWRKLSQPAGTNCALRPDWSEFLPRDVFSTKFSVETGKMITVTRRNRFYAKRRRRDETAPGLNQNVFFHVRLRFTPFRLQLTAAPGRHPEDLDFLRRHLLVHSSNRVRLLPKWGKLRQQILGGRTPPESVNNRIGPKWYKFNQFLHFVPLDR